MQIIRNLALLPLLFTAVGWASDHYTHKIINGVRAAENAWPSTVAIVSTQNESLFFRQFCAGNLIADKWVLTAAHCLFDEKLSGELVVKEPEDLRAVAGITDLRDEAAAVEMAVKAYEIHPYYDPEEINGYYDIALLELEQAAAQQPMQLYTGDLQQHSGSSAVVVGWGATAYPDPAAGDFPYELHQVALPLVSREVCNLPASYNGILIPGQFCAGYPMGGSDSCVGDSGGPMMMLQDGEYQQIGVVNFGDGCALPDKYGVYADVPYFSSWIANYLDGTLRAQNGTGGQRPPEREGSRQSSGGGASGYALLALLLLVCTRRRRSGN